MKIRRIIYIIFLGALEIFSSLLVTGSPLLAIILIQKNKDPWVAGGFLLLGLVIGFLSDFLIISFHAAESNKSQTDVWKRLIGQPMSFFYESSLFDLMGYARTVEISRGVILRLILQMLPATVTAFISIIIVFSINEIIGTVLLSCGFISLVLILFSIYRQSDYDRKVMYAVDKAQSSLFLPFLHIDEVDAWNLRSYFYLKWSKIFTQQKSYDKKSRYWGDFTRIVAQSAFIILSLVGLMVFDFLGFSINQLVIATFAFAQISQVLSSIAVNSPALIAAIITRKKLQEIPVKTANREIYSPLKNLDYSAEKIIQIQDLSYSHGGGKKIFQNLNLCFEFGKITAIVGPSGCGKTTLLHLLAGLKKPFSGCIYFKNVPLNKIEEKEYRSNVVLLHQHAKLLKGTLREAFTRFNNDISDKDIYNALSLMNLQHLIQSMPLGLDTPLSDRNALISAGERQRILLATLIVSGPMVLLLDEPTSNLDIETQGEILKTIKSSGITTILTTHRPSVLQYADVVLEISDKITCTN